MTTVWVEIMTKIRVELLIEPNEKNSVIDVFPKSSDMEVRWRILEKEVSFICAVGDSQKNTYDNANNNSIIKNCISFEGLCECDVDINKNFIDHISVEQENSNFTKLRILSKIYHLEDYYEEELKPNIVCVILSVFLANPKLDLGGGCVYIYLNDYFYKREFFIDSNIQSHLIENDNSIFKERLTFQKCWNWIYKNTSVFQKGQISSPAFSALSYILNRELHESLVYSTIGLESLFCPKDNKNTKYLLSKRIPKVFPNIEESKIKNLYASRSDIVHGNIKIGIYYLIREIIKSDDEIMESCILGAVLLVESIRKLIECNATHFVFQEKIEYKCE